MFPLHLEVILKCAFNHDSGESPQGSSLQFLEAMDTGINFLGINKLLPIPDLRYKNRGRYAPGGLGKLYQGYLSWRSTTTSLLAAFRERDEAYDKSHRFIATSLMLNEDSFLGRRLSEDEVLEEAMGLAVAGSGTTSTALSYLVYALSRPEATHMQTTLRTELCSVDGSYRSLQTLPYLTAVIKETFRLYPSIISTLPRELDTEITVSNGAIVLPKGTIVGMANYIHQRDPNLFGNPDKFLPERWLESEMADESAKIRLKEMNSALTPFSIGPRNCIGQNLARAEMYVAANKIFRNLQTAVSPDLREEDVVFEDRFTLVPKGRKILLDVVTVGKAIQLNNPPIISGEVS